MFAFILMFIVIVGMFFAPISAKERLSYFKHHNIYHK